MLIAIIPESRSASPEYAQTNGTQVGPNQAIKWGQTGLAESSVLFRIMKQARVASLR
jgi:hypothetical protein